MKTETLTPFPGQSMTPAQVARAAQRADHVHARTNHLDEADTLSRDMLEWAARMAAERGLSVEQQIFAICTATVHLRATFPEDKGGKHRFDEIAHQAHLRYAGGG